MKGESRMDTMKLERIQLYGRHGVFAEENHLGQRFYVSLELKLDLREAGRTDRLEHTVNYADVYQLVKSVVDQETYDKIREVTVRVVKPHPPFDIVFDGVTIELTRQREGNWQ